METPSAFLDTALSALADAVHARGDDLRNVQLATIDADGRPALRTLVLRNFTRPLAGTDPATAELHSDSRAAKVAAIAAAPRVSLLAWSAAAKLQLRFDATARLHREDALAHARWDALSDAARRPYGLRAHPGTPIADPDHQPHLPPDERFARFTVILLTLHAVDVLRLGPDGEQFRAAARLDGADPSARWLGA